LIFSRLTVGNLVKNTPKEEKENRSYFAKNRFPAPRLNFNMKKDVPANMVLGPPSICALRMQNKDAYWQNVLKYCSKWVVSTHKGNRDMVKTVKDK